MAAKIFRINYKSDFILTLESDAGWMTPFCIKFWTGAPSQAFYAQWDGETYTHCAYDPSEPTKLLVQFDDHHLPIGDLKFQVAYHFTVADFPNDTEDEVINPANITTEIDGETYQVMLDFTGETAPEIEFSLPAYANEVQRIANEQQRIAAEEQRITNEQTRIDNEALRISAEQTRQDNEAQRIRNEQTRISQEETRVREFATLKRDAQEATTAANDAAALANQKAQLAADKAQLAADKAALAQAAANLANQKAQLAAAKAALANDAAALANEKAALAQQKAEYAQTQGSYAKQQGDYAKDQGDYAKRKGDDAAAQMQQQAQAFSESQAARQTAYEQAEGTESGSVAGDGSRWGAFKTNEAARDAVVAAKVADITNLQARTTTLEEQVEELENIVADLETIAEGYVRVAGSSSPALSYKSYKYHEQGGFGRESVFTLFYPCLVGTKLTGGDEQVGKILHILQKLDYGHDIYGNERKIDGSEGDVFICNIEPYYRIMGKHTINGTEYDVFLMSRTPFTWQGIEAEHVEKFGWSPDYAVSHTDEDDVVRMHSVYNPDWAGSYNQPLGVGKFIFSKDAETGDIVETYDAYATLLGGSGGLQTTNLALYTGEQYAMNHNPDTTKCVPFMNQTAAGAENLQCLLLAEGGTFDAHNASKMGSGFSSNDPATAEADWAESASSAKNGLRVVNKDGNWKYHGMSGNIRYLVGATSGTTQAYSFVNSARNPWHIMEAHRAMCYAIQNGVHELEWFVFEGNKYKWRSIDGFAGPAQGEMTCVVWKLMASKAAANAYDPSDSSVSIAGNRVEVLFSTALLHGMLMQVSPAWNTSGMVMTEDENGRYECYMERDQESLIKTENGSIDISELFEFEKRYKHVLIVNNGSGYAKNYSNDALMLPNTNVNKSGGGLHTYVGKYNYFSGDAATAGKKLVRAWRRGDIANDTGLSPLSVVANYAPSGTGASFAFGTCCRVTQ